MRSPALLIALLALIVMGVFSTPVNALPPQDYIGKTSEKFPRFLPIKSVRKIRCGEGHGTGFAISDKLIVTANHVTTNRTCVDGETSLPLFPVYENPEQDFAVMSFHEPQKQIPAMRVNCRGFEPEKTYYSMGFPGVGFQDLMITRLMATKDVSPDNHQSFQGTPMSRMRQLKGVIIQGMSGGPILDTRGRVVGINNATEHGYYRGLSRPLSQTYLCQAPWKKYFD
jgi:S1-C subfamily serine protease